MEREMPTNIAGRRETPPYCTNGCGRYVTAAGMECRECAPDRYTKPSKYPAGHCFNGCPESCEACDKRAAAAERTIIATKVNLMIETWPNTAARPQQRYALREVLRYIERREAQHGE